ncbi:MAG: ABC transporter permease [Chloroflexi bacterium]|nr:ABC transporter permease [Chloroflexota bacterium]
MNRRFRVLLKKEFLQFFRNVPLIILVLYCCTLDVYTAGDLSMELSNYPVAVYDQDNSELSRGLVSRIREPYFNVVMRINDNRLIDRLMLDGDVCVVVKIPPDFSKKLYRGENAGIQVLLDGSNSMSSELAAGYISSIVELYNKKLMEQSTGVSKSGVYMQPVIDNRIRYLYNEELTDSWTFSLQELLSIITLLAILLPATAMVNEKQYGTIEQLMVTPLRPVEIMFAKILPMQVVIFAMTFISLFVVLRPAFNIPVPGNVWALFLVFAMYSFTASGIGILIATVANNMSETVLISIMTLIPIMFFSGSWVPAEACPVWMQNLMNISPLKYCIDLTFGILIKGYGFREIIWPFVMLSVLGSLVFLAGMLRFRKFFV